MFFYSLISPSHYRKVKLELLASLHNRDASPFKWNNIYTAQWICTPSFHKIIIIMAEGLVWDELLAVTSNMQDEPMPSCLLQINLESSFFTLLVLPPFGLPPCLPTPIARFLTFWVQSLVLNLWGRLNNRGRNTCPWIWIQIRFGVRSINHWDAQKWLMEIIFKKLFFQCRVLRYGLFDTLNTKVLKKIICGGLFRTPPNTLQCAAMYYSVTAWIIHTRWVKYDPWWPRMTDYGPGWHTRGQGGTRGSRGAPGGSRLPLAPKRVIKQQNNDPKPWF